MNKKKVGGNNPPRDTRAVKAAKGPENKRDRPAKRRGNPFFKAPRAGEPEDRKNPMKGGDNNKRPPRRKPEAQEGAGGQEPDKRGGTPRREKTRRGPPRAPRKKETR